MRRSRLLAAGLSGTVIAVICCFTPALVILFGVLGLSAALGWTDYVLLPVLCLSLALTAYALLKRGGDG